MASYWSEQTQKKTNLDLTSKNILNWCFAFWCALYHMCLVHVNVFFKWLLLFIYFFTVISVRAFLILCRPQLISDKGGIEITSSPLSKNGKVVLNIELLDTAYVVRFQIVNKGQKCIYFTFYTALHRIRCFTLIDERRVSRVSPLLLCPGKKSLFCYRKIIMWCATS